MANADIRSLCSKYEAVEYADDGQVHPDCLYARLMAQLHLTDTMVMHLAAHGAKDDHIRNLMGLLYPDLPQDNAVLHNPNAIKLKLVIGDAIVISEFTQKRELNPDQMVFCPEGYRIQKIQQFMDHHLELIDENQKPNGHIWRKVQQQISNQSLTFIKWALWKSEWQYQNAQKSLESSSRAVRITQTSEGTATLSVPNDMEAFLDSPLIGLDLANLLDIFTRRRVVYVCEKVFRITP